MSGLREDDAGAGFEERAGRFSAQAFASAAAPVAMKMRRRGKAIGALLAAGVAAVAFARYGLYPFLARQAPVRAEVLVVEGWLSDDVLDRAMEWAAANGAKTVVATGGPLETGSWLAEWGSYAEMTKARLVVRGYAERFEIESAPAPAVRRGRTRASARALKEQFGERLGAFNLASEGPHARRSWRAFREEFGEGGAVGSVALEPKEYGPDDWWTCSEGVRAMVGELLAYAYDVLTGGGE